MDRGIMPFRTPAEVDAAIASVRLHFAGAGVLAYPTETVYGFGGTTERASLEQLVRLKRRPPEKPFLLLVVGLAMLAPLGLHLTPVARALAARFWPGPLTLVLPGSAERLSPLLRGSDDGVAVRWTSHPALSRLLASLGEPLTSTSANLPGLPPAGSASEIVRDWGDAIDGGVLQVLDGGLLPASMPSTVVDCGGEHPRVIRPGAIALADLRDCVPDLIGVA